MYNTQCNTMWVLYEMKVIPSNKILFSRRDLYFCHLVIVNLYVHCTQTRMPLALLWWQRTWHGVTENILDYANFFCTRFLFNRAHTDTHASNSIERVIHTSCNLFIFCDMFLLLLLDPNRTTTIYPFFPNSSKVAVLCYTAASIDSTALAAFSCRSAPLSCEMSNFS